ncbi:MAG: hypothetical protein Q4A04_05615 [Eubacteriales bacterium]|nr:hypothetical protein [Eubacteriales bacterium]
MSKTKEELNEIKEEVETVNEKLAELTSEEIAQVSGGGLATHAYAVAPHISKVKGIDS